MDEIKTFETKEFEKVFSDIQNLSPKDKEVYLKENPLSFDVIDKELSRIEDIVLSEQLSGIAKYISFASIAKKYFGKSRNWLYQRINGNIVNGKPAAFTEEEKQKLKKALEDIAAEINATVVRLV